MIIRLEFKQGQFALNGYVYRTFKVAYPKSVRVNWPWFFSICAFVFILLNLCDKSVYFITYSLVIVLFYFIRAFNFSSLISVIDIPFLFSAYRFCKFYLLT